MTGTIINAAAVLIGGTLGLLFGARLPERLRQTLIAGLGLFTIAMGVQMFLQTKNPIIVLASLLVGGVLGEWWRVEDRLRGLGGWLERRFNRSESAGIPDQTAAEASETASSRFVRGFLTSSLVFCIGPMAILGSFENGMTGTYPTLMIKSVLDGVTALAFASSLGSGVLFSALVLLVYQGGLSLAAEQASLFFTAAMQAELFATGGVLLVGIAISSLLEIKPIRTGSFLPALLVAPIVVAVLAALQG